VETVIATDTTLVSTDYELRHEKQIDRLDTGSNPRNRWGGRVLITYVPVDTTSRRIGAYIRLIKLDIEYSGLDSSREGDYNSKALDYYTEREKILSALRPPGFFV
jgi:hypothetical protein